MRYYVWYVESLHTIIILLMISPTFHQQLQPQLKFNSILQLLLISLHPCKSSRTPDGCHKILPTCSCCTHGKISLAKSWKESTPRTASFTVRFSRAKLLVSDYIWVEISNEFTSLVAGVLFDLVIDYPYNGATGGKCRLSFFLPIWPSIFSIPALKHHAKCSL